MMATVKIAMKFTASPEAEEAAWKLIDKVGKDKYIQAMHDVVEQNIKDIFDDCYDLIIDVEADI